MSELKGWYSGKYDSVRQKKAICEGEIKAGVVKYQTSLRMEMLLYGLVVITDVQWYDGLFFAYMARENKGEFKNFIKFILEGFGKNAVPFAVRRRKSYMEMFKKPFFFSSIINEELQKFIYNIYNGKQEKTEEICSSMGSFLDFIEKELKTNGNKTLLEDFKQFRSGIELLDAIDEKIFIPWEEGNKAYISEGMKAAEPELLDLLEKYAQSGSFSTKKYIDDIKEELKKEFPNRSTIKSKVKSLAGNLDNSQLEEKFMHIFDHYYNSAIAKQHNCKYFDFYEAVSDCKFNNENRESVFMDTQSFPKEVICYLGKMSWLEFGSLFYNDEIIAKRNKWLAEFDRQNAKEAKKSFYDYLDCIMKKMQKSDLWLFNNSIFYRTKGTKRFANITIDEADRGIGSAASDVSPGLDEICLFFEENLDDIGKDKIVRYASTDDMMIFFDTVFAPIENLIGIK